MQPTKHKNKADASFFESAFSTFDILDEFGKTVLVKK